MVKGPSVTRRDLLFAAFLPLIRIAQSQMPSDGQRVHLLVIEDGAARSIYLRWNDVEAVAFGEDSRGRYVEIDTRSGRRHWSNVVNTVDRCLEIVLDEM